MDKFKSVYILASKEKSKDGFVHKEYAFDSLMDCFEFIDGMDHFVFIDCAIHEIVCPSKDMKPFKVEI